MKRSNISIYSQNPKSLFEFYVEAFHCSEVDNKSTDTCEAYSCYMPPKYQLNITKSSIEHKPRVIILSVFNPRLVRERLRNHNTMIKCKYEIDNHFTAEDPDGNILHIIREESMFVGFPINTFGL